MKKLLLPLLLAAVMATASCGKKNDDSTASPSPSAAATAAASTNAPDTSEAPQSTEASGAAVDTGGTNMTRMSPDEVADKVVNDDRKEKAFIGQWRAVGTTSENAAFTSLELTITEDDYTVTMSFENYAGTTSYTGSYELKDGVLTFDESFIDCTAYFYKGDSRTLVIDNGTSLVFCEHLEQESEMR